MAGIGPGSKDYIMPKALDIIQHAKVLVGGARALKSFACQDDPEQQTFTIRANIEEVLQFIADKVQETDVVVMVSGDPGYWSLLDALRRHFPVSMLEVIPGLSSLQVAFARLALPWHEARFLSMHGRETKASLLDYQKDTPLGILTDPLHNSRTVAAKLIEHGWPREASLYICERLSYADEKITQTTLEAASQNEPSGMGVLVVVA